MANTYIDTNALPRLELAGAGRYAEVLNNALCGARNVVGTLRWLDGGDAYNAESDAKTHQLIYLMEGAGTISLAGKDHPVTKGAGIYLGPLESARIAQAGDSTLKLFHLVVPSQQETV